MARRDPRRFHRVGGSLTTSGPASLRIGAIVPVTEAEGPGRRFAVWAQGCTIRCSGCFNPHLWSSAGGERVSVSDLAAQALSSDVEGVTLLGGEPFDQAEAFGEFASQVRMGGLSVMTFTGHELETLQSAQAPPGAEKLLAETDLLVDGRYHADDPDNVRPWVGSRNQRLHFLSPRYSTLQNHLESLGDRLEIRVTSSGDVRVNGWANVAALDELLDGSTPPVGRGTVR